jgi:hypothetical protein
MGFDVRTGLTMYQYRNTKNVLGSFALYKNSNKQYCKKKFSQRFYTGE